MDNVPSTFPPNYATSDYISPVDSPEERRLPVGVCIVGAGPAGLACAIRLSQLLEKEPEVKAALGEFPVTVLERSKYPGAHLVSGACVNPIAFKYLFPDISVKDLPFEKEVNKEAVYFLTGKHFFRIPTPPTMKNHGNYVASIAKIGQWLGKKAEEAGVTILSESPGYKLLVENGQVKGVRTKDKGRDQNSEKMSNFEPGNDILAQVTVLCEGTQGHLTSAAIEHFNLAGENPQIYALGVKEIWKVAKPLDRVIHTMGWPLRLSKKQGEFGGSFAYPLGEDKVSLGLVVGLDYHDAFLSVHDLLQKMKLHPLFQKMLEGGERLEKGWGAKTIPEGGLYSLPKKFHVPGLMMCGDGPGFVNVPALKGIHYAMWSGILAAENIVASIKEKKGLEGYDDAIKKSFIWKDLKKVRNMRQAFQGRGLFKGSLLAGLMTVTGGAFPGGLFKTKADKEQPLFLGEQTYPKSDGKTTFDKLSSAYASGNRSRDKQPNHIQIHTQPSNIVGESWINLCPAQVYEWKEEAGEKKLFINPTNCVHCGAITAKGGRLTPQEGGSGPEYTET